MAEWDHALDERKHPPAPLLSTRRDWNGVMVRWGFSRKAAQGGRRPQPILFALVPHPHPHPSSSSISERTTTTRTKDEDEDIVEACCWRFAQGWDQGRALDGERHPRPAPPEYRACPYAHLEVQRDRPPAALSPIVPKFGWHNNS